MLAVPFFGAGALGIRPGGSDFGATWVVGGAVIWLAAAGLLLGLVRPAERRIRAGIRIQDAGLSTGEGGGPAPGVTTRGDDTRAAGRLLMWAAAGCDVLFVAALVLMIFQPA